VVRKNSTQARVEPPSNQKWQRAGKAHQNGVTPTTTDGKTTRLRGLIVTQDGRSIHETDQRKQKARSNGNGADRRLRSFDGFRSAFINSL
jgi:hypothetical protein